MMPPLWLIKLGAVLALLAAVWFQGHRAGAAGVQVRWDAQVRANKDADDLQAEQQRLTSRAAATTYERQRTAAAARLTPRTQEAAYALHATICPPSGALGKSLELGDVPIPGSELQRLRDAGADY